MSLTTRSGSRAVETVNDTVKRLYREYHSKGSRENAVATARIGLFSNLAGAVVAAEGRIDVGKNANYYLCVRHTVLVVCAGFGCTEPLSEISTRGLILDCDHGGETEEMRLAARKHAQAHAEKCRALPHPTA